MLISQSYHLLRLSAANRLDRSSLVSIYHHPKQQIAAAGWCKNITITYNNNNNSQIKKRLNLGIRHVVRNDHMLPAAADNYQVLEQEAVSGDDDDDQEEILSRAIGDQIIAVKSILNSMDEDGQISSSPYDTAWVALIKNVDESSPLFPSCLLWIADHQLKDGSWGDASFFGVRDRMLNTLACVIALKTWNAYPDKIERGISFLKGNMHKLRDNDGETFLSGFECIFPSLLIMAQKLGIQVVEDSTVLEETYAKRELKLQRIPYKVLHTVPTTLLHSLEGIVTGLDWNQLLKLQFKDGSFFHSPSSTAFAFMETRDENCLSFLQKLVQKFDGGVPNVYPVEIFEKLWVVDRLQRLGISRHFQSEIKECLDYVYRHWSDKGLGPNKLCTIADIDDTCMAFRLFRLHGYHALPDPLRHFQEGKEFVCYAKQLDQGVSDTFNLFRASQLMFPGETILQSAKEFSFNFLKEKQASNRLVDRWLITKDLLGEVGYALDVPWYASLPHVETRFYIDQYGGDDDVWVAKTLYRMPFVSNSKYLDLARLEFKQCQAQHQLEWNAIQKWYADSNFGASGISRDEQLLAYFLPAASIFEQERSKERIAWTKAAVLIKIIESYFTNEATCSNEKKAFISKLNYSATTDQSTNKSTGLNNTGVLLADSLVKTINQLSEVAADCTDIRQQLYSAWGKWIKTLHEEGHGYLGEAELLLQTIYTSTTGTHPNTEEEPLASSHHQDLIQTTNNVCNKLRHFRDQKNVEGSCTNGSEETMGTDPEIEVGMQELVQLVYQNDDASSSCYIKQICFAIAKTFYYTSYCSPKTIDSHIVKVLFDRVD